MASNKTDHTLRLKDGRLLGYMEYGDRQGKPVFFFHGFPSSRLAARLADAAAARQGARAIAFDRPGFGLSSFKPGRTIGDWPDDVVEAAVALSIDRFAVIGLSGGGPYVAACALKIPERLSAAAIVSGVGPLDAPKATDGMIRGHRLAFALSRRLPWLARLAMWSVARRARRDPDSFVLMTARLVPDSDKAALARPGVQAAMKADVVEAFRQGSRGAAWEHRLVSCPWGFRLEDITMEVYLWQGEEDVLVPPSMGRYQAQAIPSCRATFLPGVGHFLGGDRMDEILGALIA